MKNSVDKADIIIEAALQKYRLTAEEQIRKELCTDCRDRRCERGERCYAFKRLVKAKAWEMISSENN